MSILSSRLTGEFMKAAAAAARTSQSASGLASGTTFREQFEAARTARVERQESTGASERSDREQDRTGATEKTGARDATEDAGKADSADESAAVDETRGETERTAESVDASEVVVGAFAVDPVVDAAPSSLEGDAVVEASSAGETIPVLEADAATPGSANRADAATLGTARENAGTANTATAAAGADAAAATTDAGLDATGTALESGVDRAADRRGSDATVAGSPAGRIADAGDGSERATREPAAAAPAVARNAEAGAAELRPRSEVTASDPARTGGRVEVQETTPQNERRVEPSAYRAAMADRAAGRDLSPAERQAMSLDERIASARAAAAAGRLGVGSSATGPAAVQGVPAAGIRGVGRPGGSFPAAVGDAAAPTTGGISNAGGATASTGTATTTTAAPTPTISVDAGVPARPNTAGVTSGVDAAGMPGRPGGGEDAVAQALRGARMLIGRNGGSMTMRLQPGDLGDLRVRMEIRAGRVTAEFQATSEVARERLEQGLDVLRRGLEERGLQVERLSVRAAETETARPTAESARSGRDADAPGRGDDGTGGDRGGDDAADGQSRGRREDPPARRPFAERASSPDALRAFASIFGDRTR